MPFVATWMDLEITLSELSQTEKKQMYHHSYAKSKNDTNKHIYKTETDSETQKTNLITRGERRERYKLAVWD